MSLMKHLKKLRKKGKKGLRKFSKVAKKGLTSAGKGFQKQIQKDLKALGPIKVGVTKIGGKVIKKLFPNGKDSVAKFLGKSVRLYAKGLETAGKVVATCGDVMIVVGTVTGQPELVAAGLAMDEAGNAVVVGAQTAQEASYALQYTIQGDQKAAMIALARATETGTTGFLNTLSHNTFDNFVAAAIDMAHGDFEGAGRQLGQAAIDAIASEVGIPAPQLIAQTDDTQLTEDIAGQGAGGAADEMCGCGMEGEGPKRKINPSAVEETREDRLVQCIERCLDQRMRDRMTGRGMGEGRFDSQSHVVRVSQPPVASLPKTGLAFGGSRPSAGVKENNLRDKFYSQHNLSVMKANTQRGFSGPYKVGKRGAVSGLRANGKVKHTKRSLGHMPPNVYKDDTFYSIERMQRTALRRQDDVVIEKDRKTRTMVLG